MAGQGIILRNVNQNKVIGYGVLREPTDVPAFDVDARNIMALCQDTDRLSLLFYSDLDASDQKTLYAYYQPFTRELLTTLDTTRIIVYIDGLAS